MATHNQHRQSEWMTPPDLLALARAAMVPAVSDATTKIAQLERVAFNTFLGREEACDFQGYQDRFLQLLRLERAQLAGDRLTSFDAALLSQGLNAADLGNTTTN